MGEKYRCKVCGFEWSSPEKEYNKCPDCGSQDISKINNGERVQQPVQVVQRRGRMGGGPPRVCKCTQCGYETTKTPGFPCRNNKCPQCGAPLCGAD